MRQLFSVGLFIVFLVKYGQVSAQDNKQVKIDSILDIAKGMYEDRNYLHALHLYEELDTIQPNDTLIQYALSVCYIDVFLEIEKAKSYLLYVNDHREGDADLYYYLGKAYHLLNQLDSAKYYYQISLEQEQKPVVINSAMITRNIEMLENAEYFLDNPKQTEVINIGNVVNTEYSEYVPLMTKDSSSLIFTYRGPGCTGGLQNSSGKEDERGFYFEDVFIAYRYGDVWTIPVSISEEVNTNAHDAVTSMTGDENSILLYRSDGANGDIFISEKNKKKNDWSKPKKLPKVVNSKFFESHATFTGDGNTLYFSSERPGGYGGLDIYKSVKDKKGNWGEPQNMGEEINTSYDDESPFISKDGKVLYFSSKGHNSMGGYDIFRSIDYEGKWTPPQNMGYPLNKTDDDLYFSVSADGKDGYFGSKREGGYGLLDIYHADLSELNINFVPEYLEINDSMFAEDEALTDSMIPYEDTSSSENLDASPVENTQNEQARKIQEDEINIENLTPEELYKLLLEKYGDKQFEGLEYFAQVGAYRTPLPKQNKLASAIPDLKVQKFKDGITRYFVNRSFLTLKEADAIKQGMQQKGIQDTFVIGFYNGEKLYLEDIARLLTQ